MKLVDETFDCLDLPCVPGGFRYGFTQGIAEYLGIKIRQPEGDHRNAVMGQYPEAFCRLVRAAAEESRKMMEEGVPPFTEASDDRGEEDGRQVYIKVRAMNGRFERTIECRVSREKAKEIFRSIKKAGG